MQNRRRNPVFVKKILKNSKMVKYFKVQGQSGYSQQTLFSRPYFFLMFVNWLLSCCCMYGHVMLPKKDVSVYITNALGRVFLITVLLIQ